ncbi:hypothetical protein CEXT_576171 [Caerostris extrusa]|uniref:Uncharacterized protein n=1 Tax=Caerostris extrusa TaxID=172846 RepID=A0AAV4QHJ0_CAEEX|nr:hypothetical protein CEXT_576171 [Caerostris extrusa]
MEEWFSWPWLAVDCGLRQPQCFLNEPDKPFRHIKIQTQMFSPPAQIGRRYLVFGRWASIHCMPKDGLQQAMFDTLTAIS